jgi:hypothetical protein
MLREVFYEIKLGGSIQGFLMENLQLRSVFLDNFYLFTVKVIQLPLLWRK